MSHLHRFLESGSSWAIVPESVVQTLLTEPQLERVETDFPLPEREISLVVAADNYDPIIPCLCECIDDAIARHERINSLL